MLSDSKGLNHVAAIGLLLTMLWGGLEVVGALRHGLEFPNSKQEFLDGTSTQSLEKQIDLHLPSRDILIAVDSVVRYKLLRAGGDQVLLGRDGWLFLRDELRPYESALANQTARIAILVKLANFLKQQSVHLLVILVPDKVRIAEAQLPARHLPAHTSLRYQEALQEMQAQGIWTLDLRQALVTAGEPTYYRSDTHWNTRGAGLAANAVAAAVKARGLSLPSTSFATVSTERAVEREGDLIRLMGLSAVSKAWRPLPDMELSSETRQIKPSVTRSGGLLDQVDGPPVVLVGTSYSLRGNFSGQLKQALSAEVLNAAKDGGGFLQATAEYLNDESFQSAKPLLVVWELPERMLTAELTQDTRWIRLIERYCP
ncbi:MAG: hypothetical protein KA045_01055 [Burkholderiaceae bacterium]|nr:hypothetical protein [Burkholderiaceae bacterium]